jgi:tetratricopeptide (TPR) repeat protein
LLLNSPLTPDQHAALNRILADTYYRKGDLEQAIYYQKKALSFVSQSKIPAEVAEAARIYARLGWSYFRKANFDEAQNAVIRAEELAAETNNLSALAAAENLLGGINWSLGFTDKAMQHTRLAMLHFQEIGYSWGEAMVLNNLAILEANSGNWNEAANFFQRTLNLRSEMGDVEGIALSHNNLAALAFDQGKMAEAEAAYRASLAVSEPIRISYHMVTSYAGLVRTLLAQKRHREASRILQIAFRLAIEIDAREILTELKRLEAVIHLVNGELDLAEKSVRSSLQSAIEINHSEQESSARRILSDILLRQGKSDQGLQILDEAWERLATNVDELETGRVHAQYTKLWQALGDSEKTILHKQSAYEIFNRLGASYDLEQLALI